MPRKSKRTVRNGQLETEVAQRLEQIQVSDEPSLAPTPGNIVLDKEINPELIAKWPKLKKKVPPIFLHQPVDFEQHVKNLLVLGIQFYQPLRGKNYTKITCVSFNDLADMMRYFEENQLPYHTYGNPSRRKMKVVIRGLPKETELNEVKDVLKSASIPVMRVHKMHTREERKDNTILVLVVVPHDEEGKVILRVTKMLGHDVKLEPPLTKPRQCHRCQKWGHAERYCHGIAKCVKCAGDHVTKKCTKVREEPPKCANCSDDHTANYKQCICAPGSDQYQMMQEFKISVPCHKPIQLVTFWNYHMLYKNVDYDKKPQKAIKPGTSKD